MALTVPASDLQGTILQGNINNLNTLIAANPNNTALITQLLDAQQKLTLYLLSNVNVIPATMLVNETYVGDAVIR
jgi:hypothetical protein